METTILKNLNACTEAIKWARKQVNYKEAWKNCERGDWMLWIAKRLNVDDKKLTMAEEMCVKQAATRGDTVITAYNAAHAIDTAYIVACDAATAAADAYTTAAGAYDAVAGAVATVITITAAADAADAAEVNSSKISADICRKYLTKDVLTAYAKLK